MRATHRLSLVNKITKAVKRVNCAIVETVVGLAMDTHIQVSTTRYILIPLEERKPVGTLKECHLGLVVKRVAVETCVAVVREGVQSIAVVGIAIAAKWRVHIHWLFKKYAFSLWAYFPDNIIFSSDFAAPFPAVCCISICIRK
jgi:hypothetical protein